MINYCLHEKPGCYAWVKMKKSGDVIGVDTVLAPTLTPAQALEMAAVLTRMATDILASIAERGDSEKENG